MIAHATLADYRMHIRQVAVLCEAGHPAACLAWREMDELTRHLVAMERLIIRMERRMA
jgi:hypothetical protein